MQSQNETIPVQEVATRLGCSANWVRDALQNKQFPVGFAWKSEKGQWIYKIPRAAFERIMSGPEQAPAAQKLEARRDMVMQKLREIELLLDVE